MLNGPSPHGIFKQQSNVVTMGSEKCVHMYRASMHIKWVAIKWGSIVLSVVDDLLFAFQMKVVIMINNDQCLTIIPLALVGYEMIDSQQGAWSRSAELAIIISYPTSASGIIVLLKTIKKCC